MKLKNRLSSIIIVYIAVVVTLIKCEQLNAEETVKVEQAAKAESTYKYERKITDDLLANTLKAEYPSDKWKVVPREEICVPPSPCGKKKEETTGTIHEKLKYDCPPCRKCVKEINEISRLKKDVIEYRAEISRLKQQIEELEEKLAEAEDKPPEVKIEEKRIPDDKKNYLYFSPMYAQDGIIATDKEGNAVYEAVPVESVLIGGGYTRFFEISSGLDLGVGVGGYVGQTGFGVNGQLGVKF